MAHIAPPGEGRSGRYVVAGCQITPDHASASQPELRTDALDLGQLNGPGPQVDADPTFRTASEHYRELPYF
jgi:hypothetical protein